MSHAVGRGADGRRIAGQRALASESMTTLGQRRSIKVGNKRAGLKGGRERRRRNMVRRGTGRRGNWRKKMANTKRNWRMKTNK